ncbi:MAG TPA: hypothetical protein VGS20_11285 [Candidatus Acidoferrales bacterium]|nr:hypothetical protein [Candidatus Acidoferrales bacterium]
MAVPAIETGRGRSGPLLFLASFVALYFELVVIRYLSTEVRDFAYLQNLPLIASFLGLGTGMIVAKPMRPLKRLLPFAAALFLLIAYAPFLGLTHVPFAGDMVIWGRGSVQGGNVQLAPSLGTLRYLAIMLGMTALVVAFFLPLGKIMGECLAPEPPLRGYCINLAGSLAGIVGFTAISFSGLPPVAWIAIGFVALLPFYRKSGTAILLFCVTLLAVGVPGKNSYWSPYYHIQLQPVKPPPGWPRAAAYYLQVNHDYHQKIVDLSRAFVTRFPDAEPNRSALSTYELPYQLLRNPQNVLIVGAGTGNDVAAALRHRVKHVDAVEIDPVILRIGRKYHPEHPYASPAVTAHVNDARAFFKTAKKGSYDLVEFAYLDSHTLFASFSSLRLDNYVYTLESFQEARGLLKSDGILVLAFDAGRSFVTDRLFATLTQAFGAAPKAYRTGYDLGGVVLVEAQGNRVASTPDFPEISAEMEASRGALITTDHWPFLYSQGRTVPSSILLILLPFLLGAFVLLRDTQSLPSLASPASLHLFLLGAGFLLLETRGVTQLSLVFGSTWIVNAVVIASFLMMALAANTLVIFTPLSRKYSYPVLFLSLAASLFFPYRDLNGLPMPAKVAAAALLIGMPVFFSGLVFSRSFQEARQPSRALGANLLGAVVGGALENLVMVGGTTLLGYMAMGIYGLSVIALLRHERPAPSVVVSAEPAG